MTKGDAREILNEVLSRDEFDYRPGKTVRLEWLEKIFRDISSFLRRLSEAFDKVLSRFIRFITNLLPEGKIGNFAITAESIRILVIVLISILAAVLAFLIVLIIIKTVRRNDRLSLDEGADLAQELENFANDAHAPYQLALQKKEEKDFRGAFRYLFISLLVRFRIHGMIEVHKSKTNRRYLAEIRQRDAAVYEKSRGFFDAFNLYWYGRRAISEEALEQWFVRYDDAVLAAENAEKQRGESGNEEKDTRSKKKKKAKGAGA